MTSATPARRDHAAHGWRSSRERGSATLLFFYGWLALHFGRVFARWLIYPIAFYFYCTAPQQRRASRNFLRRALGREPAPRDTWRQFLFFAATALDRLFFLSGRSQRFTLTRSDVDGIMGQQPTRGAVMLMSHLGMFDVLRADARTDQVQVSIVMDRHIGESFSRLMASFDPALAARVIDASRPGPLLVLAVKQAIDAGAFVGMMADRVFGAQRTVTCRVLGTDVVLPAGAYFLAITLNVPLIVAFGVYEGGRRYRTHFEYLDVSAAPEERTARVAVFAQRYADRLTEFATRYPYNWFNFYDFFGDAATGD